MTKSLVEKLREADEFYGVTRPLLSEAVAEIERLHRELTLALTAVTNTDRENEELRKGLANKHELAAQNAKDLETLWLDVEQYFDSLKAQSTPTSVWLWANKTTTCVFATKELAMQMNSGGASTWVEPVEVPVIGNTALKESTEPFAWASKYAVQLKESGALGAEVSFVNLGWTDQIELFTTPPTATALIEDFRKRAIEVCRKNWWEFGKYIVEEIESLPLIDQAMKGE